MPRQTIVQTRRQRRLNALKIMKLKQRKIEAEAETESDEEEEEILMPNPSDEAIFKAMVNRQITFDLFGNVVWNAKESYLDFVSRSKSVFDFINKRIPSYSILHSYIPIFKGLKDCEETNIGMVYDMIHNVNLESQCHEDFIDFLFEAPQITTLVDPVTLCDAMIKELHWLKESIRLSVLQKFHRDL